MVRLQWCRKHIDEVAEACDLSRQTVGEVKAAAKFCEKHDEFSSCPTSAITTLIRIRDDSVRDRVISLAKKRLNQKTPTGGKKVERVVAKDIVLLTQEVMHETLKESAPPELIPGSSDQFPLPEGGEQNIAPDLTLQEPKIPDVRIKHLLKILTPTHMQYLTSMVVAGEVDDEIGALLKIMDALCSK
jgi:hypothetical protein